MIAHFRNEEEAGEWLEDAKRDYVEAERCLRDGSYIFSCFHSHQAAEKLVKALLIFIGRPARGHDLIELLGKIESSGIKTEHLKDDARKLNPHYSASRYPDARRSMGIRIEDYNEDLAKKCFQSMVRIWKDLSKHLTLE